MSFPKLWRLTIQVGLFSLLVIVCILWNTHPTSTRQLSQQNEPSAAAEVKSPIIAMVMASSIDARGKIVNPSFTFSAKQSQIEAIVYVGTTNDSQLKVTWYKTSEKGDEKLFEQQIQVKSNDRAYSIGRNSGAMFLAGTYRVVASLDGQSQETEFDISPPKTAPAKPLNTRDEESLDEGKRKGVDGAYSSATNELVSSNQFGPVGRVSGKLRTVSWNASSRMIPTRQAGVVQAKPPVAGSSGSGPQPPRFPTGPISDCRVWVGALTGDTSNNIWPQADLVKVGSWALCSQSYFDRVRMIPGFEVFAKVKGEPLDIGQYLVREAGKVYVGVFSFNPCAGSGSDLPGTKIAVQASREYPIPPGSPSGIIVLGDDTLAPRVKVSSTPPRESTVKPGDSINLHVIAQEKRKNGPWQTGIKMVQITATPGGSIGDGWVNPANLPKPCNQKTWEQQYEATYKVPANPPATIRICAIAEDYIGNESSQCGDFHTEPRNVIPANCKVKASARVDMLDGSPADNSFDPASPNYNIISCNFRWSICGKVHIKTKLVKNAANACDAFFNEEKTNLTKEQFCCDCYPNCRK